VRGTGDRALAQRVAVGLLPAARTAGREGHPVADRSPLARSAARLSRRCRDGGAPVPGSRPPGRAAPGPFRGEGRIAPAQDPVVSWYRPHRPALFGVTRHFPVSCSGANPASLRLIQDLKGQPMINARCSCGFTEAEGDDETSGDHLQRVFTPEDDKGSRS
jgi:hypothetical protein